MGASDPVIAENIRLFDDPSKWTIIKKKKLSMQFPTQKNQPSSLF
jgi:hypothetical protein